MAGFFLRVRLAALTVAAVKADFQEVFQTPTQRQDIRVRE